MNMISRPFDDTESFSVDFDNWIVTADVLVVAALASSALIGSSFSFVST